MSRLAGCHHHSWYLPRQFDFSMIFKILSSHLPFVDVGRVGSELSRVTAVKTNG